MTRRTFLLGLSYLANHTPEVKRIDFIPENIVKFKDSKWVLVVNTKVLGTTYIDPTSFTTFSQHRTTTKLYAGDYLIETTEQKLTLLTDYSRSNSNQVITTQVQEIYFQQL
jgi:hypothetical protein